jgi:MarR family transcriptional regulator, 2-MHQ and catechol-resistance regulon repressor
MSPARPGPRYVALLELLRTAETVWHASRTLFARWDLGPSQFNVLNLLYGVPEGRAQSELSRELLMHRSNLTGLVDRLAARDWVRRQALPGDRRVHRVVLTPSGEALVREVLPHYYRAAEEVWGGFPLRELPRLRQALERLRRNAAALGERRVPAGTFRTRKEGAS